MPPATLRIVRFAMGSGLLLFGAVAAWLGQGAESTPVVQQLTWVAWGVSAVALLTVHALRHVHARAAPEKRGVVALAGSALAEGAALLGAVLLLLGGEAWPYLAGLLVFVVSWAWLPGGSEEA